MSKDFKLNKNYDIEFIDGELHFTTEEESLPQRIKQRLLTFKGDWFLDESLGLPYFKEILIKDYDLSRIEAIYIAELQSIDGVEEILSLNLSVDSTKRELKITGQVKDGTTGQIVEVVV